MITKIWREFLTIVQEELGSRVVETWLKAVTLERWDIQERIVYIRAPNSFVKEWIKSHYTTLFEQHMCRLFAVDSLRVVFVDAQREVVPEHVVTESGETTIVPAAKIYPAVVERKEFASEADGGKDRSHLNNSYVFDSFVVGPSNSLAYAAAHAVTERPGTLYNPLFIYGGSGLGKTHLLHAIGNSVRQKNPKSRVLYQTADRFVNEFIYAIRFDKVHKFQAKYKNVDVLLIDDIQFISNKEQTQEAFFHIFNALYDAHKQIVFSSDSYPADISGLAERLSSRLEWGLVTDIQNPTLETKIAILKSKAEAHNEALPDDVAQIIASRVLCNVRELEGSLIRVLAFASLTKQKISVELVKKVLLRATKEDKKPEEINFERIVQSIKNHYSYSLVDLRSQNRSRKLAHVRHIAMYLMKKLTDKSLHEIGNFLGRKDHTTVLHAFNRVQNLAQKDDLLLQQLATLEQEVSQ